MEVKRWFEDRLNDRLRRHGAQIVPRKILYEWQRVRIDRPSRSNCPLPADAARYLKPDNPTLIDLQRRYRAFDADVTTPVLWKDRHVLPEDIAYFRGDNAWVWQVRGRDASPLAYALTAYYLKSIDHLGLFEKLVEDDSFGNFSYSIAGHEVSRDLLDSMAEIYFLDRHLGISSRSGFSVLDVGAGYGRLAHRMVSALDGLRSYVCTDAVPVSTFVCEYYLRFRDVERASVVPLDEIDAMLRDHPIDLAVNIHSFSECRTAAIEWWIRLLSHHRVKTLMIVPNDSTLTNRGHDFLPILERFGYRMLLKEPKYRDPIVQEYGLYPSWYYLFELRT